MLFLIFTTLFVLFVLLPFVLPLLMPNKKWLALLAGAGATLLGYSIWTIQPYIDAANDRNWAGIELAYLMLAAVFFGLGVAARFVTILMRDRGWSRGYLATVAGLVFLAPFAYVGASLGWKAWEQREPDLACLDARHRVQIAGSSLRLPLAPIFNIYTERLPSAGAFYLFQPKHQRRFCAASKAGQQEITATMIWFRFEAFARYDKCGNKGRSAPWAKSICAQLRSTDKNLELRDTSVPVEAHLFAADQVGLDSFAGVRSTFSPANRIADTFFIRHPSHRTPDGKPLTASCRDRGTKAHQCNVAYPYADGLHLMFEFNAPRETIADRASAIDRWLNDYLAFLR